MHASDGQPWAVVPGNHDLQSYGDNNPYRTSMEWAQAIGRDDFKTVTDMGDVRVIGLGPDEWRGFTKDGPSAGDFILSDDTLSWLDQQLAEAGSRPVVLVTHVPPWEQYDRWYAPKPRQTVDDLIGDHGNVKVWLSGHRHTDIFNDDVHAEVVSIGGRNVACINGPSTGARNSADYWDLKYKSLCGVDLPDDPRRRRRRPLARPHGPQVG